MTVRAVPARRVRAFVAATVFTRPERAFFTLTASRGAIRKRAITARTRRIAVVAARRTIVAVASVGAPFALSLGGEAALGEFLLRPPGNARAAFAARGTVAPTPGVVVFIVVAGHERSHFGCRYK
jgi:hypothetical protein